MRAIQSLLFILSYITISIAPITEANSNSHINKTYKLSEKQIIQWREDIDCLQKELEQHHIHLYHRINAEHFSEELINIKQKLPTLSEAGLMI